MELKLLSKDEAVAAYEEGNPSDDHAIGVVKVARKAEREILRQIVEWGEEVCMEHGMKKRRRCDKCWQELKKLGEKDG